MEFEEQYQDVLQNIEFAIVNTYRSYSEQLVDYDVEVALETLIRLYKAEQRDRSVELPSMPGPREEMYETVKGMCDWRLGRADLASESDNELPALEPITVDEVIACLKRIRKSVKKWSKQGGRQGYLHFVEQYIL